MTLENKTAVILNKNSMRVTKEVSKYFNRYKSERFVIYESGDLGELDDIIDEVINEKFGSITAVGGDGNLFAITQSLLKNPPEKFPIIDLIPRGTGNGLANLVGASKNYQKEVNETIRTKDFRERKIREFPLIEITSRASNENWSEPLYYTFAGSGLDAMVLEDYNDLKSKHNKDWQKFYSHGLPGYLVTSLFKTFQKIRKNKFSGVSIILNEGELYGIGKKDRNEVKKIDIKKGQDISHVGDVQGISVGTTTEYGYGLRAHPYAFFANKFAGGMFQMRVIAGNPAKVATHLLTHIPSIWRGTLRSKYIQDYFANDITVKYWVKDTPLQIAGEAMGKKKEIRYKFTNKFIKMVDKRD